MGSLWRGSVVCILIPFCFPNALVIACQVIGLVLAVPQGNVLWDWIHFGSRQDSRTGGQAIWVKLAP